MKIAFIGNTDFAIYNYRFELCLELLKRGHEVIVISPSGEYVQTMVDNGCRHIEISVDSHGTNPLRDLKLKKQLKIILKKEKPDYVLGFTIKPNIYGAWACKQLKIPFIANITGLGPKVENKGIIQFLTIILYKIAFSNIYHVFCQNEQNKEFLEKHRIAKGKIELIPGSGVNLEKFKFEPYPISPVIKFAFVSRVRKDKGIDQFIDAARFIKQKHNNVEFHIFGPCDENYDWVSNEKSIVYHGKTNDMPQVYKIINCLVFPSYYAEGMANVLLEACASGRPVITTNRAGCREAVEDGINGFLIKEKDSLDLIEKVESFLSLTIDEQKNMGIRARLKVEKEFDRKIVLSSYSKVLLF